MAEVSVGMPAPEFSLPATSGRTVILSAYRGRKLVVYFYPKDGTVGCTDEAREFREIYSEILSLGADVIGISRDSIASHEKFSAKLQLPFPLASDADSKVCQLYGVLKEKNMYGKKSIGVERTTFIIDPDGVITHLFHKVKVVGHAADVLLALR